MIEFININTGVIYDGSRPFIHFFENGQSVNINHIHKICFVSNNKQENISINSEIFSLINTDKLNNLRIDDITSLSQKQFIKLENIRTNSYISTGAPYKGRFVHLIYILGFSNVAGEIIDSFKISDEVFSVGADFYGEDERLKNSLENLEALVPEVVQRAIYETNVHEEANDNILLNRKYKELLENYWSIIMSKGSYSSLLESLYWFEWGDLVRIEEFWKRQDPHGDTLLQFPVSKILSQNIRETIINNSKTTFYGLYCCIYKALEDQFDKEGNPKLDNILFRWSISDISLKMILLGNFYQTYFMPLHLDILHSSIEHWVFTVNQKIMTYDSVNVTTTFNNVKTFECEYEKHPKIIPQKLYFYDDTLFKDSLLRVSPLGGVPKQLGCCTSLRTFPSTEAYNRYYNDNCAVVKFTCKLGDINIKHSKVICKHDTGIVVYCDDDKVYRVDGRLVFELLFEEPGQWNVVLEFETIDSHKYCKELNIYVDEQIYNKITLYKLVYNPQDFAQKDYSELDDSMFFSLSSPGVVDSRNEDFVHIFYTDFESINTNQVCIYTVPEAGNSLKVLLKDNGSIVMDEQNYGEVLKDLKSMFTEFVWYVMGEQNNVLSPLRIIGINTVPNMFDPDLAFEYIGWQQRFVNEQRFVFGFHDLEIFDSECVCDDDLLVAVPLFKHSENVSECHWTLRNDSLNEEFTSTMVKTHYCESGEYMGDFCDIRDESAGNIGMLVPQSKKRGYYSIFLNYKTYEQSQQSCLNSAFYIE